MSNVTVQEALKAAIDAMEIEGIGSCDAAQQCKAALSDIEKCEPVAEVNEQWVIDFIGSNYNSMRTHDAQGNELPLEDITYSLTVHDLLSAFAYTSPQPREWVGLSDFDKAECASKGFDYSLLGVVNATEAKCKQLNTKG